MADRFDRIMRRSDRIAGRAYKAARKGKGRKADRLRRKSQRVAGKVVTAASKVYSSVKKGKVKGAVDAGKQLVSAVKSKRTYPKKKKVKRA